MKRKDTLCVQWYANDGESRIFSGNGGIATLNCVEREDVTLKLKLLGLKPKRWRKTEWGYESTLVPA